MLHIETLISQIEDNIETVLTEDSALGHDLWHNLLSCHPADIATIIEAIDEDYHLTLFKKLPKELSAKVFERMSPPTQGYMLTQVDTEHASVVLKNMQADKLTHLFDYLSDDELKKYLKLLQKKQRHHLISTLNFAPKSAGRIMDTDVLCFQKDFTVKKSISILQRLGESNNLLPRIYVTDQENILVGFIEMKDLLISKPETILAQIVHKPEVVINVHEDQQEVVDKMQHYDLFVVPVADSFNHFLGAVTADDIYDIIEEETSEDVYRMSGLDLDHSYFQTPFWKLVQQRSTWLMGLLLFQSSSSYIMAHYENLLSHYSILFMFQTMLIGTGGNAGNQSATLVIRGLSTGEIALKDTLKVLFREFRISMILGIMLVSISFLRVYFTHHEFWSAIAISLSLFAIVITSMMVGTLIPLILERLNIDPAHSAAPFLATLMDILGVLIYCLISSKILGG